MSSSLAWTTVLIVALILPGLGFFVGYWSQERYSREIIRSSAIGEIGMAVFMAAAIHLIALAALYLWAGFEIDTFLVPLVDVEHKPPWLMFQQAFRRLVPAVIYILVTTVLAFGGGLIIARMVM